ncbi:DNA topoisomerase 2-binding protein 1-like isoform X3 [Macrosteles quadrilineatus]|uniref:DNA topoisomerase 2-binding protein 1-like isoform X3 n=1 Tax=Macrosteles quadrilineatus TaxID=74068 RepID=UPI0023E332D0|nr:DNA topoisomerase 2-binding protein 1-like isoform X3 [Macrosteles quadrilineatus]
MDKKSKKKEVKMYFVIPDGCNQDEVQDGLKMAFQESKEAGLSPEWITEKDCLSIDSSKNVVFILQEFIKDSETFKNLRSSKSFRVCGPMCLRSCLAENKPIPMSKSPVFTAAMTDLVVTASQVPPEVKAEIKEKVSFMGGIYISNLSDSVTHLVTNAVRSAKYEVAAEKGLPIMKVDWVDYVWRESQSRNIKATDPEIMAKYKCPVFFNMFIACSNLPKKEKEKIKDLVTKHGGTFTPSMRQYETTLLVVEEPQGVKYQHARSWDLPCVRPSYIYESVTKGYAVASKQHLVEPSVQCSTPTKEDDIANFTYNSDPSISVINFDTNKTHIDETQMSNMTQVSSLQRQPLRPSGNNHIQILNSLTISEAKKAGSFVDGCKVYLSGYRGMDLEKLVRILSLGGATVFSEMSDSVSHVILGEFVIDDVKALSGFAQKPHVVSLEWLAASIKQRAPATEESYHCLEPKRLPEPPSPLSQKGMELLKPPTDDSAASKMPPPPEPPVNRKLFSEFIKENIKSDVSPMKSNQNQSVNSTTTSQDSYVPDLFLGKKFLVVGYDTELTQNIVEAIEESGGTVVATNFKGVPDYAVVPVETPVPNVTAMEVVTPLWLEDCNDAKELVKIEYYHQPLIVDTEKKPLTSCCLTLSSYTGREKAFLVQMTVALGAVYQDTLVKVAKKSGDQELLASTHLVCPKPEGKKFTAATRWGLTIVTKDWLLACAHSSSKVPETSFLVSEIADSSASIGYQSLSSVTKQTTSTSAVVSTPKPTTFSTKEADVNFKTPTSGPANPLPHPAVNSLKRKSSAITPDDHSPFHVSTPDTPYGQFVATPTTESKKRWKRYIDEFPSKPPSPSSSPRNPRRQSTPISELKRRAFALALETSEENVNPNYSIEEMEEEPESAPNQPSVNASMTRETTTPRTSAVQCKKNIDSNTSLSAAAGWSSPSVCDFKVSNGTPSSNKKKNIDTKTQEEETRNEMVCKMLHQLHQRLSNTPNTSSEEKRPHLNYKHLTNYENQPATSSYSTPANPILDPESQPILMGWDDPVESAERARMMNMSSSATSKPRRFVFSNVEEKELCEERLRDLGETVSEVAGFDMETTHLIVDKPVRSEKLLCCLAGGRWVLHTSFIERMVACGKYVPEEEKFEWGNPLSSGRLPSFPPGDLAQELAESAYRWRTKVNGSAEGAFKGLKAMLFTTPAKSVSYQRLIIAGGGVVLPSILSSVSMATHCFMEINKVPNLTVPLSEFVTNNVPCLLPVYLAEMLTSASPNMQDSLIPEYKKLLAQNK